MAKNSKCTSVKEKNFLALYSVTPKVYYTTTKFDPRVDLGQN